MPQPRTIAILLHETHRFPKDQSHMIWSVARAWKEAGIKIRVLKGTGQPPPPADLLISHVDLTRIPPRYLDYMSRFRRVINGAVTDISKRKISTNLLAPGDDYSGPVIVKSNSNFGGVPEQRRRRAVLKSRGHTRSPGDAGAIKPFGYRVFKSLSSVPPRIWENRRLVVEKFIPEQENGHYAIRVCIFLGDVHLDRRIFSRERIIKGANRTHSEVVETPEELLAIRERLGFDYGKFDYVMHDGRVHLLDANRTPGKLADGAINDSIGEKLAAGIEKFLDREPASRVAP